MKSGRVRGPAALGIIGPIFALIGCLGLIAAGTLALMEYRSGRDLSAVGTIVGFDYGPVVEFTAAAGEIMRFGSPVRSSFWHRGDRVAVAYAAQDPGGAAIDGLAGRWFLPALFGLLGSIFAAIGLVLFLVGRHLRAMPPVASA